MERHRDHYGTVDKRMATRAGGALMLFGAAYIALLTPLDPPTDMVGAAGWVLLAATLLVAAGTGARLFWHPGASSPTTLLWLGFAALAGTGLAHTLAGPRSPFADLALLVCLFAAAIHPRPRVVATVAAAIAIVWLPLAVHGANLELVGEMTGRSAILGFLTGLTAAWMGRLRKLRAELSLERQQAVALARVDALTGLGNRRAFDEALGAQRALVERTGRPLSVLVGDLDHFKAINDGWGHPEGDRALREVARVLRTTLRRPDACFRWGGDEFVVVLTDTALGAAELAGRRAAAEVAARCRRPDGTPLRMTVGWAQLRDGEDAAGLLARADAELLRGKDEERGSRTPA